MKNNDRVVKNLGGWLLLIGVSTGIYTVFNGGFDFVNLIAKVITIILLAPMVFYIDSCVRYQRGELISGAKKKKIILCGKIFPYLLLFILLFEILLGAADLVPIGLSAITVISSFYYARHTISVFTKK